MILQLFKEARAEFVIFVKYPGEECVVPSHIVLYVLAHLMIGHRIKFNDRPPFVSRPSYPLSKR
jgi:hypothetical protein